MKHAPAASLGLTRVTRFVSLLELGLHSNSETGKPRQRGWEIELGIFYIESLRDFWLAESDLQMAMTGSSR